MRLLLEFYSFSIIIFSLKCVSKLLFKKQMGEKL